jgi:3-oxo-4,17-pregnadiene-20-carboxyl-CoA hydratase alpha subunit
MKFRILKFRPREQSAPKPLRPRPAVTMDSAFWFDGAKAGKLLIQRCASCGRLRHPPGPACPACLSYEWDTVEASGRGTVHSYVVNHYPQVPAFDYPLPIGLIELDEGTRLVADLVDVAPEDITVGMPVEATFVAVDDELTLPMFRPVAS